MNESTTEEQLLAAIKEMLGDLFEAGWERPLRCAAIAANGAVMVLHIDDAPDGTLESHFDVSTGQDLMLPINMMWVDATGERAERAVLRSSGVHRMLN